MLGRPDVPILGGEGMRLIVLDRNLFEIDPHDIYKARVELEMTDGVVRHREGT